MAPNKEYTIYLIHDQELSQREEYINIFRLIYANREPDAEKALNKYKQGFGAGSENIPRYRELKLYYTEHSIARILDQYGGDPKAASRDLLEKMNTANYYTENGSRVILFQNVIPIGGLSTRQYKVESTVALHVVGEGGLLFAGWQEGFNVATSYVGINVSFRPLDSEIPLSILTKNNQINWYHRFTVNIGVTLNSIAKTGYRSNLFGNNNIIVGLGYKFNHFISLIGGGMIYNNNNPNPLLDKKTVGMAPYAGLSINLKIKDALGEISKVFSYGK